MAKPKKSQKKGGKLGVVFIVIGIIIALIVVALVANFAWSRVSPWLDDDEDKNDQDNETVIKMPIAILEVDKEKARVGETITFDGNKSHVPEYEGNLSSKGILIYTFDYGYTDNEGNRAAESLNNGTAYHSFPERGTYTITLTVEDERGLTNKTSQTIEIVPQDLQISTSTTILIGDPIGPGIIGNTTELDWNLSEGATFMRLNITITGANIREGQQNTVEIVLENPQIDVIKNDTVRVLGTRVLEWTFDEDEIEVAGRYNLIIKALDGTAMVNVAGLATYI